MKSHLFERNLELSDVNGSWTFLCLFCLKFYSVTLLDVFSFQIAQVEENVVFLIVGGDKTVLLPVMEECDFAFQSFSPLPFIKAESFKNHSYLLSGIKNFFIRVTGY